MEAIDYSLSDICGVLVSHGHSDHAGYVKDFVKRGKDCYMSHGTSEEIGIKHHRIKIIEPYVKHRIGDWTVTPFDAIHDTLQPFGFIIRGYGEKILFSGDTAYIKHTFKSLTRIMVECNWDKDLFYESVEEGETDTGQMKRLLKTHMNIDRVKSFLSSIDLSKTKQIILIHGSSRHGYKEYFKNEISSLINNKIKVDVV